MWSRMRGASCQTLTRRHELLMQLNFTAVVEALKGRFRVVTTSLLGYGGTQECRTLADCSIDREVETLEAVVRK